MSNKNENYNKDPICKLYLKLSKNKNISNQFFNLIIKLESDIIIKTNSIDRIDKNNINNITILDDDMRIESAKKVNIDEAKNEIIKHFQNILNNFIDNCKKLFDSEYNNELINITNLLSSIKPSDVFRNNNKLSVLEKRLKIIKNNINKIRNYKNKKCLKYSTNYGTGLSKNEIDIKYIGEKKKSDAFYCHK